jgi:hypothetical protein
MTPRNKLVLAHAAVLAALPCAFALADSEVRNLTGFTGIDVSGSINVDIRIGDEFHVEVDGDEDAADIITEVRGNTLHLKVERDSFWSGNDYDDYNAFIVMPALTDVEASGGSDLRVVGTVTGDNFELSASGGTDIEIELAVDALDVSMSGGTDVELSGTANRATIRTSGGSDLDARDLRVKDAELRASGGADMAITVLETLDARASGAADITYYGDPEVLDSDASGGSDISHR